MELSITNSMLLFVIFGISIAAISLLFGNIFSQDVAFSTTTAPASQDQRLIKYNVKNPAFTSLDADDQMDFAMFMLKYNVDANVQMNDGKNTLKNRNFLVQIVSLDSYKRLISKMNGLIIFLVIGILVLEIILLIIARFFMPFMVKRLAMAIGFTLLILFLTWILNWLYTKVETATNDVQDAFSSR